MRYARLLVGLLWSVPMLSCGDTTGPPAPGQILLAPSHPVVGQGDTLRLTAMVLDANGATISGVHPSFASADLTIATVDANGLVTSVGRADTVRITARFGNIGSYVDLVVTPQAASIHVAPDSVLINVTDTSRLQVELLDLIGQPVAPTTPPTYTSSDTSIAKVDQFGQVYSSSQTTGTATITITADTFVVQRIVHVVHFPSAIVTSPLVVVLPAGGTRQLSVTVVDVKGFVIPSPTITFQSGNPALFSVSPAGLVTSLGPTGSASVNVTGNTVVHSVPVYVGSPPAGTLVNRVKVPGAAGASAVSATGEMFVTLVLTNFGMRGNVSTLSFSDTLVMQPGGPGSVSSPVGVSISPDGTKAYVGLRGPSKVGVVDLSTNGVNYSGVLGAGSLIYSTAVSSDGLYLFVGTTNWVYRLDAVSLTVIDSIGASTPFYLAVNPTQQFLYVSNYPSGGVDEVDWTTMTVTRSFATGGGAQSVAVAPDGATLYIADRAAGAVVPFDLGTGVAGTSIAVPQVTTIAISGNTLYATSAIPANVYAFDRTTGVQIFTTNLAGSPGQMAIGSAGILIVPNIQGWVDFIQ